MEDSIIQIQHDFRGDVVNSVWIFEYKNKKYAVHKVVHGIYWPEVAEEMVMLDIENYTREVLRGR